MNGTTKRVTSLVVALLVALAWAGRTSPAAEPTRPIEKGQRVFTAGHSFLMFMPPLLKDMARAAGIKDQVQVGVQGIGGSRVIQHWNLPDNQNKAKEALKTGKVDVLILSPIFLSDAGIDDFTKLALEHNPAVRVLVQEFWLPFDAYNNGQFPPKERPAKVDHNAKTAEQLRKEHAPYFKSMDAHMRELNEKYGKPVLFVVPVGQAVLQCHGLAQLCGRGARGVLRPPLLRHPRRRSLEPRPLTDIGRVLGVVPRPAGTIRRGRA